MITNYVSSYKELDKIIMIGTIPRSRSSLTAGIFKRCGGFVGDVTYDQQKT